MSRIDRNGAWTDDPAREPLRVIEVRWGRFFPPRPDGARGRPPAQVLSLAPLRATETAVVLDDLDPPLTPAERAFAAEVARAAVATRRRLGARRARRAARAALATGRLTWARDGRRRWTSTDGRYVVVGRWRLRPDGAPRWFEWHAERVGPGGWSKDVGQFDDALMHCEEHVAYTEHGGPRLPWMDYVRLGPDGAPWGALPTRGAP